MMRVVEGEIRYPAETSQLPALMRSPMRLTNVFDQWNFSLLQLSQQCIVQCVKPLHVGQEYRAGPICDGCTNFPGIHPQGSGIDVDEDRSESILQYGSDIGDPRQWRNDHFAPSG